MPSSLSTPRPVEPAADLSPVPLPELLAAITDHRDPRGVRHRLDVLLTIALAAVSAVAKSYTDIADWVNDPVNTDIAELGVDLHRRPSEPTIRRALSGVDADLLDRIIGARIWMRTASFNSRRVIAVDGKTVRGAPHPV
ncbi:hypothetical protein CVAR_2842 [Corynebacterium variabile DSM 44702]|uniref:H repeat-associated protein N-terminal domain-containing protein n=1 Tax=Corynebacterium variabile (strain DSM 44702 / CIP 107183 / JCM 12073 / NCIMB 30131) TaxID=858619 RepID=G0HGE3_CORVD|nr:transposase family protein [Corynebacterium variabile]AEK38182.1 hypothetical protein CVAR_2842 [Corynebacterium variabile DSM 44702]